MEKKRVSSPKQDPKAQVAVKANASKVTVIYVLTGWNRWRALNDFWSGSRDKQEMVR